MFVNLAILNESSVKMRVSINVIVSFTDRKFPQCLTCKVPSNTALLEMHDICVLRDSRLNGMRTPILMKLR